VWLGRACKKKSDLKSVCHLCVRVRERERESARKTDRKLWTQQGEYIMLYW